jgi:RND family efflux transporter MFP subunit
MKTVILRFFAIFALSLSGCRSHADHDGHGHGAANENDAPSRAITHWTEQTELFVEFPVLIVGQESPFAAHLTRLSDFKAVDAGDVTVILSGGDAPEERFGVSSPLVPGIFRPVARPEHALKRRLAIQLEADGLNVTHDLGEIDVFPDLAAARLADEQEEEPGLTSFLKEQQWRVDFGTEIAAERTLRPSIPVHGELRARPDGEVRITAPTAGRLLTAGKEFPRIGMPVTANQLLASLAPQLGEGADLATLELAVAEAQFDVTHAERERERLERLHAEGVVPERRVVDTRHQEESARAQLQAAQRRLSHFRRLQRPSGSGARGIELRSPIEGVLAVVYVAPGAFVEANQEMFYVVALDRLWLEVRVPEANVGRLSDTSGVWFDVEGFDRNFEVASRPVAIGGVVDPQTRTVPFVFELENPEHQLLVGMSVRAHVLTGEPVSALAVPVAAVVNDGGQDVIYVQAGGESFDRRIVQLGARDGQFVEIRSGLRAGEHVVVRGAYAVKLASSSTQPPASGHAH